MIKLLGRVPSTFFRHLIEITCLVGLASVQPLSAGTPFDDSFAGTTLSTNWNQTVVVPTGPGGGGNTDGPGGSMTTVKNVLQLLTGAGTYGKRWIRAAATDYAIVNNTQTFQVTLSGRSGGTAGAGSAGSGVIVCLVGNGATDDELKSNSPWWVAPNVLQMTLTAGPDGTVILRFTGKANSPKAVPKVLATVDTTCSLSGGTYCFTIANHGADKDSTVTVFVRQADGSMGASKSVTFPPSFNAQFNDKTYLYLLCSTGSSGGANTYSFSNFKVTTP